MLTIDGSQGEGGGQILRTSLALAMCLGKAFQIKHIRATRPKPGLQPQHLAAVNAAATISGAEVNGGRLGSQTLSFIPQSVQGGEYRFAIGTAGSTTLLFQTLLPALMQAEFPSRITLEGGTHNPMAPPFEFLKHAFLPLIIQMGPDIKASLVRPGYLPAGGGELNISIQPATHLQPLDILQRGKLLETRAEVLLSHLPSHIADRELAVIAQSLKLPTSSLHVQFDTSAIGPGNCVSIIVRSEKVTEVFTALGKRGLPAERVASLAVRAASEYLASEIPVGHYLADQLLLPLALAGRGAFITGPPSLHTATNIAVITQFTHKPFITEQLNPTAWRIQLI
jgi:RNA 3'-terminal phosphate cyclase (ATP)